MRNNISVLLQNADEQLLRMTTNPILYIIALLSPPPGAEFVPNSYGKFKFFPVRSTTDIQKKKTSNPYQHLEPVRRIAKRTQWSLTSRRASRHGRAKGAAAPYCTKISNNKTSRKLGTVVSCTVPLAMDICITPPKNRLDLLA